MHAATDRLPGKRRKPTGYRLPGTRITPSTVPVPFTGSSRAAKPVGNLEDGRFQTTRRDVGIIFPGTETGTMVREFSAFFFFRLSQTFERFFSVFPPPKFRTDHDAREPTALWAAANWHRYRRRAYAPPERPPRRLVSTRAHTGTDATARRCVYHALG